MMNVRPKCAIIHTDMLAMIGLRSILEEVMPIMDVSLFRSLSEMKDDDHYAHFFVAQDIVVANMPFFRSNSRRTIILTTQGDAGKQLAGFHSICTSQSEETIVRQLLALEQMAHAHGRNLPPLPEGQEAKVLSDREIEVLSLIVHGLINKEIADRLNISVTTVISHRKNITEKLGLKSVSALTIYAVMHGYVDINSI